MIDLNSLIETARKTADKSPCRFKISCLLVDRRGNIVATGFNHRGNTRSRLGKYTVHAEIDALNKVRKPSNNLTAFIYRKKAKIITPCHTCAEVLRSYGIDVIWHTTGMGVLKRI